MQLSGVRPSVRLSVPSGRRTPAAASLLLWARRPRDIDRLLHGRRVGGGSSHAAARRAATNAGSATLSADVGS